MVASYILALVASAGSIAQFVCLGLATTSASAQSTWSYIFDPSDSSSVVLSCTEDDSGKLFVLGTNALDPPLPDTSSFIHLFGGDGLPLGRRRIETSTGVAFPNLLLNVPGQSGFIGVGGFLEYDPIIDTLPYKAGYYRFNDEMELLDLRTMGPATKRAGTNGACIAPDTTVVGMGVVLGSVLWNDVTFQPYRFSSIGDSLRTCSAFSGTGFLMPYTMHPWPNGGYLCASFSPWYTQTHRSSLTIVEEDLCTVRVNMTAPQVLPLGLPFSGLTAIGISINALPVGQDKIILAGESYVITSTESTTRSAVQVVDTTGALVRQRTFHSAYPWDSPAEFTCLDTTIDDLYYYGQMDGYYLPSEIEEIPNDVHVYLLDSMLNTVGEYILDGHNINMLYQLRRIRAARDGGVFLMGRVMDFDQVEPQWQGWIAKIGRSEFTTTVPERTRSTLRILPNPGSSAFSIALGAPVTNAQLTVVDALGQLVHVQDLFGVEFKIDASLWPAGAYWVRVIEADGTSLVAGRWLKQ